MTTSPRTSLSRTPIDPLDVLAIDATLSSEEILMRDTVRSFVGKEILPHVGGWFEPPTDMGEDLLAHEASHRVAHQDLFGAEGGIDCEDIERVDGRSRERRSRRCGHWRWFSKQRVTCCNLRHLGSGCLEGNCWGVFRRFLTSGGLWSKGLGA